MGYSGAGTEQDVKGACEGMSDGMWGAKQELCGEGRGDGCVGGWGEAHSVGCEVQGGMLVATWNRWGAAPAGQYWSGKRSLGDEIAQRVVARGHAPSWPASETRHRWDRSNADWILS